MTASQFAFGIRTGLFLMVEAASLSAISVSVLLCYIGLRSYRKFIVRRQSHKLDLDLPATDATDSIFFLFLLFAELIQALGGLLNIKWMVDGYITEGSVCTAQGVLKQFGDVGEALMSLAITFQTFFVLVCRMRTSPIVSKFAVALIWLFLVLIVSINAGIHSGQVFYGDTDYWCWIAPQFKTERVVCQYLWMWAAAGIMIILYGLIAIIMRGIIVIDDGIHLGKNWSHVNFNPIAEDAEEDRASKAIANVMLFYPSVYLLCVIPITVVRWLDFGGHYVPPAATITASIILSLSGFLNVILYKLTRPELISGPKIDVTEFQGQAVSRRPAHNFGQLPGCRCNHLTPTDVPTTLLPGSVLVQSPVTEHGQLPTNLLGLSHLSQEPSEEGMNEHLGRLPGGSRA